MPANTFGEIFRLTTCGESHGEALLGIVDGCPPLLPLSTEMIQPELNRRRPGSTVYGTPRCETDEVRIVSGVFEGLTTGTPIGMIIENRTQRSGDYSAIADLFRPGHADYTYLAKYGIRDYRGGGRASARETAMRVAGGAIARQLLRKRWKVEIDGCVTAIGPVKAEGYDPACAAANEFNFADSAATDSLKQLFADLTERGDSVGAVVEVRARGVPPGWGSPVFARLDAAIAGAMMGINAAKGVEIGDGFALAGTRGSEARDEMRKSGFLSNHSGGVLGGISSGQEIRVRVAFKPTSSIRVPGRSLNRFGDECEVVTRGRHDPCVGIRAVPVAEAMLALCLADAALAHEAQCSQVPQLRLMPASDR